MVSVYCAVRTDSLYKADYVSSLKGCEQSDNVQRNISIYCDNCKKVLPIQATKALRAGRGITLPNLRPRHWRWGWGAAPRPGRFLPPGKTRYPLYRRLGGLQGRSGRVRKISFPPPWFDPRTVQPVASRYTGWAISARKGVSTRKKLGFAMTWARFPLEVVENFFDKILPAALWPWIRLSL